MSMIILFIMLAAFVLFFYGIGLRYLWALPLLFFVGLLGYYTTTFSIKKKWTKFLEKYGMILAWVIILGGLFGLMRFLHIDLLQSLLGLFTFNLIFRLGSYIFGYKDGKLAFQIGFYLSLLGILILSAFTTNARWFLEIFSSFRFLHLAVIGFFVFIIGIRHKIEKYLFYKLLILSVGAVVLMIIHKVSDIYIALLLTSLLLTVIFAILYFVLKRSPPTETTKKNISLRRILAGDKITTPQSMIQGNIFKLIHKFLLNMPNRSKHILEFVNTAIVIALIVLYVFSLGWDPITQFHQTLFWMIIISFVANVFFLKKSWFTSIYQKLIVFTIINFAIYVSLFSLFNGQFGKIALGWILWNLLSSAMIFLAPKTSLQGILQRRDYLFWLATTLLAMLVNIFLLNKSSIQGQLIFPITLVYLWLQGMILFYALKYVKKLHNY